MRIVVTLDVNADTRLSAYLALTAFLLTAPASITVERFRPTPDPDYRPQSFPLNRS